MNLSIRHRLQFPSRNQVTPNHIYVEPQKGYVQLIAGVITSHCMLEN